MNTKFKIAAGSILLGGALASSASASQLFSYTVLGSAGKVRGQIVNSNNVVANEYYGNHEGGEAKCGEGTEKAGEAKCGEGKCGDDKKPAGEAKCGEGKCGDDQAGH